MKVPLMRDTFLNDTETRARLAEFVKWAPRLSMGDKCAEFEDAFSKWQGRRHSVLFNSGSSANLALVQALIECDNFNPGDLVGVSALTWATNAMPLIQLGMMPIAFDVELDMFNISTATVYGAIETGGQRVNGVFATNALGFMPRNFATFIEDNCEGLGTELANDVKSGNCGFASTFSFFVGHHLSTIEGGMVCTDDPGLADMLKMVRAHGWDRNLDSDRQKALRHAHKVEPFHAPYIFYVPGYNLRPTEITGFLGLTQLPLMDEAITKREAIYERLAAVKAGNPDFMRHDRRHIKRLSAFCFPMVCVEPRLRTEYLAKFNAAGVEVRPLIAGNIQRQPFWKAAGLPITDTPGADFLHDAGFYAPLRPDLTEREIVIIESCLS
jgi:CDP-6-deoxy-D-xylo-4-hexulose-3-dehydrase